MSHSARFAAPRETADRDRARDDAPFRKRVQDDFRADAMRAHDHEIGNAQIGIEECDLDMVSPRVRGRA